MGAVVNDDGELCPRNPDRSDTPHRPDLARDRNEESGLTALLREQLVSVDPAGRPRGNDALRREGPVNLTHCSLIPSRQIPHLHRGRDGGGLGRGYPTVLDDCG